jgi:hypothetical protein
MLGEVANPEKRVTGDRASRWNKVAHNEIRKRRFSLSVLVGS